MNITTDPNSPEFREALRKIGAPEWFPQNAPRHITTGISEQKENGTWLSKFTCPICGWEKHFESGEEGLMKTVNKGDRWTHHSGSIGPIEITGIETNQQVPELWHDLFGFLKDEKPHDG